MNTRRIVRFTLSIVVIGSLVGLAAYADQTGLAAGVQAPLYALIAATGLAVERGGRADKTTEWVFNFLVRMTVLCAAVLSAYLWLLSEEAGTGLEVVGAVGAGIAVLAFLVNLKEIESDK